MSWEGAITQQNLDPFHELPDDPELAFLQLEAHFRAECERRIELAGDRERTDVIYVDYIAQVLAAITELGLEANFREKVPNIEDVDYNTYLNFNKDVKHFRTILEIRHQRRAQGYSVQFDNAAKTKIKHHLDQLQELFQKLEIEERKREDLFASLNELRSEVDRNRTHYDRLAAFTIETAGVVGDAVDRSKILELLGAIARVFWGARASAPAKIAGPTTPKRIEPPRSKTNPEDDEIPF
jgi:hypothetical protein